MRNKSLKPAVVAFLVFLMLIGGILGSARGQVKLQAAVMELEAIGLPKSTAQAIGKKLQKELARRDKFLVLSRGEVEKRAGEQGVRLNWGCNEEACLVKIGEKLGVERMFGGSVARVGRLYIITLKKVDVSKKKLIVTERVDGDFSNIQVLNNALRTLAQKMAESETLLTPTGRPLPEIPIATPAATTPSITAGMSLLSADGSPPGAEVISVKPFLIRNELKIPFLSKKTHLGPIPFKKEMIPGYYDFLIQAKGYKSQKSSLSLMADQPANLWIDLEKKGAGKTKQGALYRSAILPGWGQLYSGKVEKGIIFTTIHLGLAGLMGYSYYYHFQAMKDYERATDRYRGATEDVSSDDIIHYREQMDSQYDKASWGWNLIFISTNFFIGYWIYNMVDAYLFYPEEEFSYISPEDFNKFGVWMALSDTGPKVGAYYRIGGAR